MIKEFCRRGARVGFKVKTGRCPPNSMFWGKVRAERAWKNSKGRKKKGKGRKWVTEEQIRKDTKIKPTTLNNAIVSLKNRKIIIPKPGRKGEYRLPNKSFAVWIKAYTQARGEVCASSNLLNTETKNNADGDSSEKFYCQGETSSGKCNYLENFFEDQQSQPQENFL